VTDSEEQKTVFLTGATGYVGGRLAPRLLEAGYRVRCLVRSERKLKARPWASDPRVEVIEGNILDIDRVAEGLRGCLAAYYLVHSMLVAGDDYAEHDRKLAAAFAEAADRAGVPRIVYLGGLGEIGDDLSQHLASRREVEAVLENAPVPVTVFRAAMIIGSGSASFEILRYLVERLPVMVTPRWVSTECQPISIRNVVNYMVSCLDVPETVGQTLDIGGPDVLTYRRLMEIMAEELGLRHRFVVPVPVLTPRLSSLWIHLVTPVSARIARPLAEGLRNRVVCRDARADRLMPQKLLTVREAIAASLGQTRRAAVETTWTDAGVLPGDPDWAGGTLYTDRVQMMVDASPEVTFHAVCRVGGGHGYYFADWLWRIRGAMDLVIGGPGLRRGRRHPDELSFGDALDFWRVMEISPPEALRLRAEMKLPGEAELEFEITPADVRETTLSSRCRLRQTARFKPKGLLGVLYWYAVLPFHGFVFRGMIQGIRREAMKLADTKEGETEKEERPDSE
jgi:uncharacterized protein YbjT (DUF2867 family)